MLLLQLVCSSPGKKGSSSYKFAFHSEVEFWHDACQAIALCMCTLLFNVCIALRTDALHCQWYMAVQRMRALLCASLLGLMYESNLVTPCKLMTY